MRPPRHPEVATLVLAAGQGTRMNSDLAKVLHLMAGRPLLAHVLDTLERLGTGRVLVVIGHQHERVRAQFAEAEVEWVVQAEQRGTGHAVLVAAPALRDFDGTLLVVPGDAPLLRGSTLHELLIRHRDSGAAVTVLSARVPDARGYGRIVRDPEDPDHGIAAIVEERDATPEQLRIDEINSAIYAFHYPDLALVLGQLTTQNRQGEYYLTDSVELLKRRGLRTEVLCGPDYRELIGINTVDQLREAELLHSQLAGATTPESEGG